MWSPEPREKREPARTHKDVEFAVDGTRTASNRTFKTFAEAASFAVAFSAGNGEPVNIDVLIWSEAGAKWWGGDDAVEQYREDPEASVSDRIVVRAESVGRVA